MAEEEAFSDALAFPDEPRKEMSSGRNGSLRNRKKCKDRSLDWQREEEAALEKGENGSHSLTGGEEDSHSEISEIEQASDDEIVQPERDSRRESLDGIGELEQVPRHDTDETSSTETLDEVDGGESHHPEVSLEPSERDSLEQVPTLDTDETSFTDRLRALRQAGSDHQSEITAEVIGSEELEQVSKRDAGIFYDVIRPVFMDSAEEAGEKPQAARREVYKMPDSVDNGNESSLIFWPANFIILAVAWQLKVIFLACTTAVSTLGLLYAFVLDPVQITSAAGKNLSELFNSRVKPLASDFAPRLASFVQRFGWGVLAVTYALLMLAFLVLPVLLVEYFYVTKFVEVPLDVKAPLYFNYTEARPSAYFRFISEAGTGEELSRWPPAFSWDKLRVGVSLTLPESDYNRQLGMFQVAAEILSARNEVVVRSSRPCMLRFQSVPIRYARTLIYSVPVLLDVAGEYQILELEMINLRRPRASPVHVASVKVLLEPRAGFGPGSGLPELYASEIQIRADLPWKKSLVYKWRRTLYVWSATVLFVTELGIVLCCFRQLLIPKKTRQRQLQHNNSLDPPSTTASRRARSQVKKRVSFQEN
ncbi:seipin-1 [Selaginella moellendorffii]|uniref:seipin-1 n=1 Tax=Selaginella moellendorffii TaxID=88036 RepID=UPI000D1CDF09|nr:seipin-1 [Selaginella moellendorffii]XP_024537621.1 seipin-1 [Selaginella moellendorffii]XP_024537622.1 seipin-1 [Selaginella moellendorffii]|eukprot:XP_002976810.2 seipin-1 [Selaginella moellendorffii]